MHIDYRRLAVPIAILLIVLIVGVFAHSTYYLRVGALIWIYATIAIGLNLFMGYAGQVNFGHAGFVAIGAYSTAILPKYGVPAIAAVVGGLWFSGIVAYLVGKPVLRLRGHYLAVATLAFTILVSMIFNNEGWLTGGPDGMAVPRMSVLGFTVRGPAAWYWISGSLLVFGAWVAGNLVSSSSGRALRALNDSEIAAQFAGVDVARAKLGIFIISAIYASAAGICLAYLNGSVTPEIAGYLQSVEIVVMVILGGMGSIAGSFIGAAIMTLLPQFLSVFQDYEQIVLGALILVIMIFLPHGIASGLQETKARLFAR